MAVETKRVRTYFLPVQSAKLSTHLLVRLCTRHHRPVHEGGFQMKAQAGDFAFYRPNGERIPPAWAFPRKLIQGAAALMEENRSLGLEIYEETGAGRWDGLGMDWGVAIHGLFEADGGYDVQSREQDSADKPTPC